METAYSLYENSLHINTYTTLYNFLLNK